MTFLGLINDLTMLIEYVAVEVLRGTRTSPVRSRALFTCIAGVCVLHLVREKVSGSVCTEDQRVSRHLRRIQDVNAPSRGIKKSTRL